MSIGKVPERFNRQFVGYDVQVYWDVLIWVNVKKYLSEYPKLIKEWHHSKNGSSRPEDFTYRSGKKVWWLCPKGHEYHSVIAGRTSKKPSGCPHCYNDGWNSSWNLTDSSLDMMFESTDEC